ncbi:MAG: hypothetical protein WCJ70_02920 [bacterium]
MKREAPTLHPTLAPESLHPTIVRVTTGSGVSFVDPDAPDPYLIVDNPFNGLLIRTHLIYPCSAGTLVRPTYAEDTAFPKKIRVLGLGEKEAMYVTFTTPPPNKPTIKHHSPPQEELPQSLSQITIFDMGRDSRSRAKVEPPVTKSKTPKKTSTWQWKLNTDLGEGLLVSKQPSSKSSLSSSPLRPGHEERIQMSKIEHGGQGTLFENHGIAVNIGDLPDAVDALWNHTNADAEKPYHKVPVLYSDEETGIHRIFYPAHSYWPGATGYPLHTEKRNFPGLDILNKGFVTAGHTCGIILDRANILLFPTNGAEHISIFIKGIDDEIHFQNRNRTELPSGMSVRQRQGDLWAELAQVKPGDSYLTFIFFDPKCRTLSSHRSTPSKVIDMFHVALREKRRVPTPARRRGR